ncbi:hypothetical protein AB5I41_09045 [Sphingomonas sp. MMS24-JH45]
MAPSGDLSTDLGATGPAGDDTVLTYRFTPKAGDTAFAFDAVFFTEELPEYDGTRLSDLFSIKLNGIDIGRLSNGTDPVAEEPGLFGSGNLILNAPDKGRPSPTRIAAIPIKDASPSPAPCSRGRKTC